MGINSNNDTRDYLNNILESNKISEKNKEDIQDYLRWLEDRELSDARKGRYLQSAKKVLENNSFRLKTCERDQVREVHRQIQESAYYHKEYTEETKCEYKKFLRSYFRWANDGEVPEKAQFFSASVSETVKDRTKPHELPKPQDIKFLCQNLTSLRNKALLLTHWDLGSRIGETLNLKVGDYYKQDGAAYLSVTGNKRSDNRNPMVLLAEPAIDLWLENEHPNPEDDQAYLFCLKQARGDTYEKELPYNHASYRSFARALKSAKCQAGLDCDVNTHAVRKGRISYLKLNGVPESSVDKRVGHIIGSDVTREYTRLSDSDSNKAYAQSYGEEDRAQEVQDDLHPLQCQECQEVNPGFRDRCIYCNGLLEIREIDQFKTPEDRAKELIMEVLDEKGVAEDVMSQL